MFAPLGEPSAALTAERLDELRLAGLRVLLVDAEAMVCDANARLGWSHGTLFCLPSTPFRPFGSPWPFGSFRPFDSFGPFCAIGTLRTL